jgi:plastocyanin
MRRLVALLVAVAGLGLAAPAVAMNDGGPAAVGIEFVAFTPPKIDVLAGDTASWHNMSARFHTVTADDGSWSSLRVAPGSTFTHRFDAPGVYTYYCQIHPVMRGEVDVHRLLLTPPAEPAAPGRPYVLSGRAALPAGTVVRIVQDDGTQAATATVDEHEGFSATIVPHTSATYRAVAGADSSPAVQLLVLDRSVFATRGHRGRRWTVRVRVAPASPGARVVLQLKLRERFGWWPQRSARLDARSRARFSLRLHRRVRARVALTLRDGATVLALSKPVWIGSKR